MTPNEAIRMAADILGAHELDPLGLARATALIDLHREVRIAMSSTLDGWSSLPIGSDIKTVTSGGRQAAGKSRAKSKYDPWDGDL